MGIVRDADGTMPEFAWPGGYPLIYVLADGAMLCSGCASGGSGSLASEAAEEAQWRIVGQDIHWEG